MSDIDPELRAALEQSAPEVRVVGDLAGRAIARDRSNRRRELGTALVAGGLVLAVAVPVSLASLGRDSAPPIPTGPTRPPVNPTAPPSPTSPSTPPTSSSTTTPRSTASQPSSPSAAVSPTSIPTLSATASAATVRLRPAAGAVTGTTDVGYVVGGVYRQGSTTITLPSGFAGTDSVLGLGAGVVAAGRDGWQVVDASGRAGTVLASAQQIPAVDEGRTHVLFNNADGDLAYADADGSVLRRLPARSDGGFTAVGLDGTTAYASVPGTNRSYAWDVTTGAVRQLRGELHSVNSPTRTGLVMVTPPGGFNSTSLCYALIDLGTGARRWDLCAPLSPLGFSADGAHLLATGHVDGLDTSRLESLVVLRTADGAVVAQVGGLQADAKDDVVGARMSADQSLTLQVWNGDRRSLQRCTLDGACEVVGAALPLPNPDVPDEPGPYVLSRN